MTNKKKVKKNISKVDMQKKSVKKAARSAHKPKKESKPKAVKAEKTEKASAQPMKKDRTGTYALIAAIIGLALIGYFLWTYSPAVDDSMMNTSSEAVVLATVNGEEITNEEVDTIISRVPEPNRAQYTQESVLDQLITEKVLLQKADELNISINDSEIEEFMQLILTTNQLDEAGLEARLQQQGLTMDDLMKEIEKQVRLTKLVDEVIDVNISEDEMEEYYNENIDFFITSPEQVNASHILVCYEGSASECEANRTQEEALERAEDVYAMVEEDNFADLAMEYSDGPSAPRGGNLGFFTRGQMVSEFEETAFSMDVGDVSEPVETQFGYHIIKVFNKTEESLASFEEAQDSIRLQLEQEKKQVEFQDYIDELRSEAAIEYES